MDEERQKKPVIQKLQAEEEAFDSVERNCSHNDAQTRKSLQTAARCRSLTLKPYCAGFSSSSSENASKAGAKLYKK